MQNKQGAFLVQRKGGNKMIIVGAIIAGVLVGIGIVGAALALVNAEQCYEEGGQQTAFFI